jgi:hypothetical protein
MLPPEIGKDGMSHYRIYTSFAGDRIARPTQIFTGDNDQEAIQLPSDCLTVATLRCGRVRASSAGLNDRLVLRGR